MMPRSAESSFGKASMTRFWPAAWGRDAIWRQLSGILLALLMVAAATFVAWALVRYLGVRRGSVIYLLPVMLAGWHLGLVPALVAAVAGVLWSGYWFYAPFYTLYLTRPNEIVNLVLFMIVALVTSHLANLMKLQTEIARKRENQMSDLYAFSRRLAAAPTAADIYNAIEEHLAALVQREVILFGTGDADAATDGVPQPVRTTIGNVQHGKVFAITVPDGAGNTWLVRRVSQRTPDFGVIAIDLGTVPAAAVTDLIRQVDEALADAAATLERLDVARALNEAKMRSETELLREALIGSVSHELRTPLAAILGAATVLRRSPAIEANPQLCALTEVVRDEAERLNNDIQNLLDATRISRDQVRPHPEWIEPVDIVNSALERRRRRLETHHVTLDMDSNLPFIHVDPVLIQQAFVQVVDNAAKYSPGGSTINVSAKRNGREVVLAVQDHGAGITADRLAATASGSGLGLWIAKAFVGANGGRIHAMSAGAHQGSTVSIHLPYVSDDHQPRVVPDE
jgi:two-component system, OmpR family, sensor histidine kinase KdpD